MIAIIDYGLGNVKAFANVYKKLNIPVVIAAKTEDFRTADKIILPGVGAFDYAMTLLEKSGMQKQLIEMVIDRRVPVLGICVGMQMMAKSSEEGKRQGLGWIDGEVKKIKDKSVEGLATSHEPSLPLPHMGWNDVKPLGKNSLFGELEKDALFYFLHSYYFNCQRDEDILAVTDYGGEFACAVRHKNIYGVQFHPEKSHRYGIKLLKNFAEL